MNTNYWLLVFVVIFFILLVNLAPWDLPAFRYNTFIFPILAILNAKVILNIKKINKYIAIIVLLLLLSTNYIFVVPFKILEGPILKNIEKDSDTYLFIKDNLRIRYFLFDYLYEITRDYNGPSKLLIDYLKKNSNKNEKFLTNDNVPTFVFYTNMLPANSSKELPNWIIPRKPSFLWSRQSEYDSIISKVDKRYERIIINSTDYIYPLDSPHPRVHRFRENKEQKTSNIYPYETYPIEIYRLKK